MTRLMSILRALARRSGFEDGMSEELRFHIDQYAGDLVRGGMPRDQAMRRARLEFGNIDNVKDDCREARGLRMFDVLQRDTRHAVRLLRRSPGFTLTALATLALCLGANLTIFAVVDSVLLRPLPFPDAARLMSVFNSYPRANVPNDGASLTNYYERRGSMAAFSHVAAWRDGTSIVGETGATERIPTTRVSPEFFETLGMPPIIGRGFTETETAHGTDRVAVLTDAFWRQRLNADPNVLGRSLRVNGGSITIVGVLPPEFRFLSSRATLLAGLFSALALLLTAIGTYRVLSYAVAQRRREIGLRMALGARPEQVRAQFLSIAVRLLACGTAVGFLGAWLAGRAMGAVLFQVPALHTPTLAAAAVVLATVSMIACVLPSHRAARISPMEAMASD